jgi:hypothetical protein
MCECTLEVVDRITKKSFKLEGLLPSFLDYKAITYTVMYKEGCATCHMPYPDSNEIETVVKWGLSEIAKTEEVNISKQQIHKDEYGRFYVTSTVNNVKSEVDRNPQKVNNSNIEEVLKRVLTQLANQRTK